MTTPHAAFYDAFEAGDLAAITAYLSHPDVRAVVAQREALVAAGASTRDRRCQSLLETAVTNGQFAVIQWFFSPPRIESMHAMLALVLPDLTAIAAVRNKLEILEFFLSVDVTDALLPSTPFNQQSLLDCLLLSHGTSPDAIQLLLAHGANINEDRLLSTWSGSGDGTSCKALVTAVDEGAFIVGADLLIFASNAQDPTKMRRLLQLGADCDSYLWNTHPLHLATEARDVDTVRVLVEEGVADVDSRDDQGRTPLLMACSADLMQYEMYDGVPRRIAQVYLKAGADTSITDSQGRSPLRWAMEHQQRFPLMKLLLAHGADPNEQDAFGRTILDALNLGEIDVSCVEPKLTILLEAGADPLVPGAKRLSAHDQLLRTVNGRSYIKAYPEFFSSKPSQ